MSSRPAWGYKYSLPPMRSLNLALFISVTQPKIPVWFIVASRFDFSHSLVFMEPFSALAVATSAVQFIDFTAKVLSQTHTLRNSSTGQSEDHRNLESVTKSLKQISASLSSNAGNTDGASVQSQDDKDLQMLCQNCQTISIQLLDCLKRLKVENGSTCWSTFRQALQTIWSREELDALEKNLDRCRQQLMICILVSLR